MTDREKLIELIAKFCGGLTINDIQPPYGFENLADYLISNGATMQERATDNEDWFGIVRWCDEDIRCALQERGYTQTQNNVDEVRRAVENNSYFRGSMIEAGWDCIYCTIDDCADNLEESEE